MTVYDRPALNEEDAAALLIGTPFASLSAAGAPLLILNAGAGGFAFANAAALDLFGTADLDALNARRAELALAGLVAFASPLPAGAPPRLALIRLHSPYARGPATFICQHRAGPGGQGYVIAAAPALKIPARPAADVDHAAAAEIAPSADVFDSPVPQPEIQTGPAPVKLRFVWQTDTAGALRAISTELQGFAGHGHAPAPGEPFAARLAALGADPGGRIAAAMEQGLTWSAIELIWPLGAEGGSVPVTFAGVPALNGARQFEGYRGFGVIHTDRRTAPLPASPPEIMPPPAAEPPPADIPAAKEPLPAPTARIITMPPPRPKDAARTPEPATPEAKPALTLVPRDGARKDAGESVTLSPNERNAFREIARALGARIREDGRRGPPAPPAADAAPAETPQVEIAQPEIPAAELPAAAPTPAPHAPAPAHAVSAADDTHGLARNAAKMFDRIPVGLLVTRGDVAIVVNRTLLDYLGYADADHFHESGGSEKMFKGRAPEKLAAGLEGGPIPIVASNGVVLPVDARIQTIDWDGLPATLMTFRRSLDGDQAARLRALELDMRVKEGEARELHAILDTATDGVAVIDDSGTLLALNRSGEALFGYDQNEVVGEKLTILLAPESHAGAMDYLEGLKTGGVASVLNDGRDVIGRERQGGSIPVFMTLGRVGSGAAGKFCAVLRDQTQWKKAERDLNDARRQAERASALKSDFLAKISHEIRTPLNAILGFAEVIMDERFGPVGNARYKDYLKDIHTSGTHVMSLVNDLLDLSKIEAGREELTFAAVDANKIITECVSLMQPAAAKGRVIMRSSLAPRLPNVVADERSLRQIVLNILSNAVKFNEAGGQVIVSTALTDAGHAVIRVKDTGIGMSDAEVDIALEPFRQISTSRSSGGTGLGLPLTKALAEANRAGFTIKSKKGEGTLVEIAFPPTRVLAE